MSWLKRSTPFLLALGVLLVGANLFPLRAQGLDPLEELRKLKQNLDKERLEVLEKETKELKTISYYIEVSQIRFYLDPVYSTFNKDADKKFQKTMEKQIRVPLQTLLDEVVKQGDEATKLALATRLSELEVKSEGNNAGLVQYRNFILTLSSAAQELVQSGKSTPKIRQAAAKAVANLPFEPSQAVAALGTLFEKTKTPGEKRAGADALAKIVLLYDNIWRKSGKLKSEIVSAEDVLELCKEILPVALVTLGIPDQPVRRSGLESIVNVTDALDNEKMLSVPTQKLDKDDVTPKGVKQKEEELKLTLDKLSGVIESAVFTKMLTETDPILRLLSLKVLEHAANIRLRLMLRRESVNLPSLEVKEDVLLKGLQGAVAKYAMNLTNPDPEIRLAAVEFLERIGEAAKTETKALAARLKDDSPFVRWAAARALGKIGFFELRLLPSKTPPGFNKDNLKAVALALASGLGEKDVDVRISVAEQLGGLAYTAYSAKIEKEDTKKQKEALDLLRLALPALLQSVQSGDREARVAILKTIGLLGITTQQEANGATPVLISLLQNPDAKVRAAAADTLGRLGLNLGDSAALARTALLQALSDDDDSVRRAAGDALLKIKK